MYIKKIIIKNFKCFEDFELDLDKNLNILVGDNEAGKSTIIEAINLALSGWINGKYLKSELSESLFNKKVVDYYIESINALKPIPIPSILIELYCDFEDEKLNAEFNGNKNLKRDNKASGIRFEINFNDEETNEYINEVLKNGEELKSLPIEYCDFSWESFSRKIKIPKTIPLKSSLIDSSNFRYQNGADVSTNKIIQDKLTKDEEVKISQVHRKLKDDFSTNPNISIINTKLGKNIVTNKEISLQIETSTKNSWESSLIPYVNGIPIQYAGRGEQCLLKIKLSLDDRNIQKSNIVLIEEAENHLSFPKLNQLIKYISDSHNNKQIVISTHSSFVANKLGLEKLILLNNNEKGERKVFNISQLSKDTQSYFQKLPGYDTLRLILCKKAILVEGPSDELIIQRAYLDKNLKLPIEDGIDVISVGSLAFERFLDISKGLKQPTFVITDNDGNFEHNITQKYSDYIGIDSIKICFPDDNSLVTLENNIVEVNSKNLDSLREILEINIEKYPNNNDIIEYMKKHKTDVALKIFDSDEKIEYPQYILDAIN